MQNINGLLSASHRTTSSPVPGLPNRCMPAAFGGIASASPLLRAAGRDIPTRLIEAAYRLTAAASILGSSAVFVVALSGV